MVDKKKVEAVSRQRKVVKKGRRRMDDKKMVEIMNRQLSGQNGVAMLMGDKESRPKYLGKFVKAELRSSNLLLCFSKHDVLHFTPMMMLTLVGKEKEDGSMSGEGICVDVFIGDRSFHEIVAGIIKS